jgi:hypothetical protein
MYQTTIFGFDIVCTVHSAEINLYNQTYMQLNVYKTDEQNLLEHVWYSMGAIIKESSWWLK